MSNVLAAYQHDIRQFRRMCAYCAICLALGKNLVRLLSTPGAQQSKHALFTYVASDPALARQTALCLPRKLYASQSVASQELALPANRMKLSRDGVGVVKDHFSLAFYNVSPDVTLTLGTRERGGGRKK